MPDSPDQEPNPGSDAIKDDVDHLIAQAEALAGELAEDVGEDTPTKQHREKEFFASETESESSLNLQLARANAALNSTATQLGSEEAPPAEEKPRPKKTISLPKKKKKVPAAPPPEVAGIVAAEVPESNVIHPRRDAEPATKSKLSQRIFVWLKPVAQPLAASMRPILDTLDRLFHWATPTVRTACGWASLIITVAAIVLLVTAVL